MIARTRRAKSMRLGGVACCPGPVPVVVLVRSSRRCVEVATTVVDIGGAALHLGEVDETGLVEVGEAAPFGADVGRYADPVGVSSAARSSSSGVGGAGGDGVFAGEQDVGAQQRGADLVEDEGVEGVGADVAFRAALVRPAGSDRVVVAAVVVAVPGAVTATHLVTVDADAAHEPHLTRPRSIHWPGSARRGLHLAVVARDLVHRLERSFIHNGRNGDGDPFLARAGHLLGASAGTVVGDRLGAVEVDPADVCLVVEDAADRGGAPDRAAARRWRHTVGVQPPGDLPSGVARAGVVVEDTPHVAASGSKITSLAGPVVSRALAGGSRTAFATRGPPRRGSGTACPAGTVRRSSPVRTRRSRPALG